MPTTTTPTTAPHRAAPSVPAASAAAPGPAGYATHWLTDLAAIETARTTGVLGEWEQLLARDPTATFFQSPVWCLPWYRCYHAEFRPLVLVVTCAGALVGLVPLAVEQATGRLTFASDNMADYRDVVAADGHRAAVVAALLRHYRAGAYPNVLRLGPLQPESATAQLAVAQAHELPGLHTITRTHTCWRLWFDAVADLKKLTGKESVRRRLNYFKRQGAVTLERIETAAAWAQLRASFFAHHSLRQLQAGRAVSFNDERKRAFYETLLLEHPAAVHLTALRVGARYVAEHFGYLWRDVLYWGAPAHDVGEDRNSPGQLMLALLIQATAAAGLRGIDFTLGVEEFKQRFGTECALLPTVEIYASARRYYARRLRDRIVSSGKRLARGGGGARALAAVVRWREQAAAGPQGGGVRGILAAALGPVRPGRRGARTAALTYLATPATGRAVAPQLPAGAVCEFHLNELADLTRWPECAPETHAALTQTVRLAPDALRHGRALHTVVIAGQLAAWGWAARAAVAAPAAPPVAPAGASESGAADSVVLTDFYVLPAWRGRHVGAALVAHVLQVEFAAGAMQARAQVAPDDMRARKLLARAGLQPAAAQGTAAADF